MPLPSTTQQPEALRENWIAMGSGNVNDAEDTPHPIPAAHEAGHSCPAPLLIHYVTEDPPAKQRTVWTSTAVYHMMGPSIYYLST